jgi:hypothetical protein
MICDVTHSHYTTFHHSLDTSFSPTLVGFENGIENNRSSLDKECSQIENKIALEKSKAIGRLNELEKSLNTKLYLKQRHLCTFCGHRLSMHGTK